MGYVVSGLALTAAGLWLFVRWARSVEDRLRQLRYMHQLPPARAEGPEAPEAPEPALLPFPAARPRLCDPDGTGVDLPDHQ